MTILVAGLSWALTVSILILAIVNGMALRAYRAQSASVKELLSQWLTSPAACSLGILVVLLFGLALWLQGQTGLAINTAAIQGAAALGRASLLLGTIILVLGAAGFFFSDPGPDRETDRLSKEIRRPTRRR